MAWIAVNQDQRILGVAFARDALAIGPDITYQEISDDRATDIMHGRVNLQHAVAAPPPPAVPANTARESHWSRSYPAMMSERDVDALINLAGLLPDHAVCVEAGSRLGGSTKIFLDNAVGIKRFYSFEPEWANSVDFAINDPYMAELAQHWGVGDYKNCYEYAKVLLGAYPNVRLMAMDSPYAVQSWWTEQLDLFFEDSMHTNPQMRDSLDFWVPLVRSGGIVAGHDYSPSWPDVVSEADALAQQFGVALQRQGTVWWLIKP